MDPAFPILYTVRPKGIRCYFSDNIARAVDIGIDESPISRSIQAALDPLATKLMLGGIALFVFGQRITIQEAGLDRKSTRLNSSH